MAKGDRQAALGAKFREVRERQNVTLHTLSTGLGCSVNTVRWHEAGARMMRADMLERAAAIMQVNPSELIGENSNGDAGN